MPNRSNINGPRIFSWGSSPALVLQFCEQLIEHDVVQDLMQLELQPTEHVLHILEQSVIQLLHVFMQSSFPYIQPLGSNIIVWDTLLST